MSLVLDTHAIVWYASGSDRLSATARQHIEEALQDNAVVISAITLVELIYLVEKRRLPEKAFARLLNLIEQPYPPVWVAPLDEGVATTLRRVPRSAIPDMPDRIIAATALHLGLPLVTRDRKIQLSEVETLW